MTVGGDGGVIFAYWGVHKNEVILVDSIVDVFVEKISWRKWRRKFSARINDLVMWVQMRNS